MAANAKKAAMETKPAKPKTPVKTVKSDAGVENKGAKVVPGTKSVTKPGVKKVIAEPVDVKVRAKKTASKPAVAKSKKQSAPKLVAKPAPAAPKKTVVKKAGKNSKDVASTPAHAADAESTKHGATQGFKPVLNPTGAWPFPTGLRPK
jgi:hypothetical protein